MLTEIQRDRILNYFKEENSSPSKVKAVYEKHIAVALRNIKCAKQNPMLSNAYMNHLVDRANLLMDTWLKIDTATGSNALSMILPKGVTLPNQ